MEDGVLKRKLEQAKDKEHFSIFNSPCDATRKILLPKTNKKTRTKSDKEERVRLPSGLNWSPKVKSIKDFLLSKSTDNTCEILQSEVFSKHDDPVTECSQQKEDALGPVCSQPYQLRYSGLSAIGLTDFKTNNGMRANPGCKSQHHEKKETGSKEIMQSQINEEQTMESEYLDGQEVRVFTNSSENVMNTTNLEVMQTSEEMQSHLDADNLIKKLAAGEIPDDDNFEKAMDLRLVMQMFATLRTDLSKMDTKIGKLTKENTKEKLEILTVAQQNNDQELTEVKSQLDEYKIRTAVLTGTVGKMGQVIQEMQEKIERLEMVNCKRMMLVQGFYASEKKYIRIQQLQSFISEDMLADATVEDAYFLGEGNPPNIVITFTSVEGKLSVMENKYRIKDYVNKDDKKMYFRDYFPQAIQESKKRQKEIIKVVKDAKPNAEIVFGKKGTKVDSVWHKRKVSVPDPTDILQMDDDQLAGILNMKISKSPKAILKDNVFVSYSICTDSITEVQRAYMHVKLANAGARHVVCAWYIPNQAENLDECDYQDDEEIGMGRYISQLLLENDMKYRAVFVARHYSSKIGQERFAAYGEAVKAVITQSPFNQIIGKDQKILQDEGRSPPAKKPSYGTQMNRTRPPHTQQPTRGGRGGYRGRGGKMVQEKKPYTPKSEELLQIQAQTKQKFLFSKPSNVPGNVIQTRSYSGVVAGEGGDDAVD